MTFKRWLVIAAALFGVGVALGLLLPELFAPLLMREIEQLGELGGQITPFQFSTFLYILSRNAIALLGSFLLSPLALVVPVLSLVNNGMLLSFVGSLVAERTSTLYVVAALLPHGIFEIPALVIGQAASLSFGALVIRTVLRKQKSQFKPNLKIALKYLAIAYGLLIIAAAMETFVSPRFLG